ncbi:MAG: DUF4199 domain-containing protein [Gammaproteobacteria bacterium]
MSRIIWTYGIISGAVVIGIAILTANMASGSTHIAGLEWLGYLVMLLALSLIFVGIKRYRDQQGGGVISFWHALRVGLGISAVAGVIYVAAWEVNLAATDYRFIDDYNRSVLEQKRESGATPAQMAEATAAAEKMKDQYGNPAFRLPMTFMEIFPVGLIISLISAAALRRAEVLPAG